jgi:hypothetical protein
MLYILIAPYMCIIMAIPVQYDFWLLYSPFCKGERMAIAKIWVEFGRLKKSNRPATSKTDVCLELDGVLHRFDVGTLNKVAFGRKNAIDLLDVPALLTGQAKLGFCDSCPTPSICEASKGCVERLA